MLVFYPKFPGVVKSTNGRACKKQARIEMKSSLQSWDNHGYCGAIMIEGGGQKTMMLPQLFGWRGRSAPPPLWRSPLRKGWMSI